MRPAVRRLCRLSCRLETNRPATRLERRVRLRTTTTSSSFASLATQEHLPEHYYGDDYEGDPSSAAAAAAQKHCSTCSCEQKPHERLPSSSPSLSCHTPLHDLMEPLPKPNPEPKYSVRRRIIPPALTPLNSPSGRHYLVQALLQGTAASYLTLTEHSLNQSDPAYCGITTLLIVLNALAMDPQVRWKGGWRYYGSEDMLLQSCHGCLDPRRIEREGITLQQFLRLAHCQGLDAVMKQPITIAAVDNDDDADTAAARVIDACGTTDQEGYSLDDFRQDVLELLSESPASATHYGDGNIQTTDAPSSQQHPSYSPSPGILVTSFGRSALDQTGDGHFSPIAAYHKETDQVLVMDVARFKYQHYWVKLPTLYQAMQLLDKKTLQPRGWYKLYAPRHARPAHSNQQGPFNDQATAFTTTLPSSSHFYQLQSEDRRTVDIVPLAGQGHPCPVHAVKVEYCPSRMTATISSKEESKTTNVA